MMRNLLTSSAKNLKRVMVSANEQERMADLAAILARRRAATDEAEDDYAADPDALLGCNRVVEYRPKDPVIALYWSFFTCACKVCPRPIFMINAYMNANIHDTSIYTCNHYIYTHIHTCANTNYWRRGKV